jgi:hypothetical protein
MNSAFVFIKPHANTPQTQALVSATLASKNVTILAEGELTGEQIDAGMLIDQHYYAIASKATLVKPAQLPVSNEKFQAQFGISWDEAQAGGNVYNALDACKFLEIDADTLDVAWGAAKKANKLVKLGGGFYAGLVDTIPGKPPIYTFNGFFMSMRAKFVVPGSSIHYYVVQWNPSDLPWADFRGKVLGPTDPANAPADSLRGQILANWGELGLKSAPDTGDNGVHASASPFEGLCERMNWLKVPLDADEFGQQLLGAGLTEETIRAWSVDPQVKGRSVFDTFEDLDVSACVTKAVEIAQP